MYQPRFVTVSGSDWAETVEAIDDTSNQPLDWTGVEVELQLRDGSNRTLLLLSSADGGISLPGDGLLSWVVSKERLSGLRLNATYGVGCRMITEGGTSPLFAGSLSYIDGEF